MNKQNLRSRLRKWLNEIPIEDAINRQMASLLQVMLIGLVIIIIIAMIINLILLVRVTYLAGNSQPKFALQSHLWDSLDSAAARAFSHFSLFYYCPYSDTGVFCYSFSKPS